LLKIYQGVTVAALSKNSVMQDRSTLSVFTTVLVNYLNTDVISAATPAKSLSLQITILQFTGS